MGWTLHHVIVATTWDTRRIEQLIGVVHRQELPCAVVHSPVNNDSTVFVGPDGSKEGWPESDHGDRGRAVIKAWLEDQRHEDGSTPWDWVEVQYGDVGRAYPVRSSEVIDSDDRSRP